MSDNQITQGRASKVNYRVWRNVSPVERAERLQAAISRVVNDESTEVIAADMGITRTALNMAFLEYAPGEWQQAQVARALTRLEVAQAKRDGMEAGTTRCDMVTLTLARDSEKSAQWQLERLCRRLFGQDVPISSGGAVTVNIGIRRGETVDAVTVEPSQSDVTRALTR